MSRFSTSEPYTFTSKTLCGAYCHEVENLDLSARGFPGFSFTGELAIEPDDSMDYEDWYIASVHATNLDGKTYTTYTAQSHPALFKAICEAVVNDSKLYDIITEMAREHGSPSQTRRTEGSGGYRFSPNLGEANAIPSDPR